MEESKEEVKDELKEEANEEVKEEVKEETKEELKEKQEEKPKEKRAGKHKKIVKAVIITLIILLAAYIGMAVYFMNHFYFGTEINGINVSGKTVNDAKTAVTSSLQAYTLGLKERGDKREEITGSDIGLKYNSEEEFAEFKDSQNPFAWVVSCFVNGSKTTVGVSHDEKLLRERIDKLSCFNSGNIIEPRNPGFEYTGSIYVIADEVKGNRVDKEKLYSHAAGSILKGEAEIDLESLGCYINPQYNSKSQKVIDARDTLNKYISSKITYNFGENQEVVDGSIINEWLIVGENFEVILNEEKVREYIDGLARDYNTVGRNRSFVTSSGETISIGHGTYGRSINKPKEIQSLILAIKSGQIITKEPAYSQTALSRGGNDIGNTYVEISISRQHIWFYKNGSLVADGDVVTGNVSAGHATPKGVYRLKDKRRDVVLRGPDYASPVTYWMPFNGGIGIHDANWRSRFGGNIYKTNGSHGCVNAPYDVAKTIFSNINVGTPVICY